MRLFTLTQFSLLLLLTLNACQSAPNTAPTTTLTSTVTATPSPTPKPLGINPLPAGLLSGTDEQPWWNDAVFYEIFVRSFYDSDGDGIGDFAGITAKLDYLNDGDPTTTTDLGITGIWLMPIFPSPSYHGYDITDYTTVNPEYGTIEQFQLLLEEAHKRGIHIIIDLVLNHTSTEHTWFQEALDPNSAKRDWYLWSEENPGYGGPYGQQVWHFSSGGYYYAVFWSGMPDLNYNNPEVTAEMEHITRFWLEEMNVDGFRLDAIKHIVEDGRKQENTPQTLAWLAEYHTFYKSVNPNTLAVGEVWSPTNEVTPYINTAVDIAFEFNLAEAIVAAALGNGKGSIPFTQRIVNGSYPNNQYAVFLTNHDQNRVMTQLNGNVNQAKVAATTLLTSPGVPFIYYGEEIGMEGSKPDENIRLPMQWEGGRLGGFTTEMAWRRLHSNVDEVNVALQDDDPNSLLNHYRSLIQLRNRNEALRIGSFGRVDSSSLEVHAFLRASDQQVVLIVINFSDQPVTDYTLNAEKTPLVGSLSPTLLLGMGEVTSPQLNSQGGFSDYQPLTELPPYSSFVIQLTP